MPEIENMLVTVYHVCETTAMTDSESRILSLAEALQERGRRKSVVVCRAGGALHEEAVRRHLEVLTLPLLGGWDVLSAYCLKLAADVHGAVLHPHTPAARRLASVARLFGAPPAVEEGADADAADAAYRRALAPLYQGGHA